MEVGNIVQFKPDRFKGETGIQKWALKACEKGTLLQINEVQGKYLKLSIVDDPEVQQLLDDSLGKNHKITLNKNTVQIVQSREGLRKMLKDGKISDQSYLASLASAVD